MREKAEDPYVSLGICSRCHKGILGTQYKMCAECREKKAKVEAKRLARETPEQAEARKERVRTRYYMNKSSGICVKCGKRSMRNCFMQQVFGKEAFVREVHKPKGVPGG